MIDPTILIVLVVVVIFVIPAVVVISAVNSNNRGNVETLEEANQRLMEMREEYYALRRSKAYENMRTNIKRRKSQGL